MYVYEQFLQIDRINNIYKVHSFGACGSGFGFEIKEVCVYTVVPLFDQFKSFVCSSALQLFVLKCVADFVWHLFVK